MSEFIRQGQPPHASLVLGDGPRTVGQSGCLLCCLVMAARRLHPARAHLDVAQAIDLVKRAGGFFRGVDGKTTASLVVPVAAKALGLALVDRDRDITEVEGWLRGGRPVIVGVDYRIGASSGFSTADHFLLALRVEARNLVVADPTFGREVTIDLDDVVYRGGPARLTEALFLDVAA